MTDFDKINRCEHLQVTELFEPYENELTIAVCIGNVSDDEEYISISDKQLGPVRKVNFDSSQDEYIIFFDTYISYFVVNESFNRGMRGDYTGNKIRQYQNSNFIDFCKQQNIYFNLWDDKDINHFGIITENHIIHILTRSQPEVKHKE